jgi:hypothetical protein
MIKFLRECFKDYHAAQQELAKHGIFNVITLNGIFTYIDPTIKDRVNTTDDKSNPIRTSNKQP